jgi:hypothetical protein
MNSVSIFKMQKKPFIFHGADGLLRTNIQHGNCFSPLRWSETDLVTSTVHIEVLRHKLTK